MEEADDVTAKLDRLLGSLFSSDPQNDNSNQNLEDSDWSTANRSEAIANAIDLLLSRLGNDKKRIQAETAVYNLFPLAWKLVDKCLSAEACNNGKAGADDSSQSVCTQLSTLAQLLFEGEAAQHKLGDKAVAWSTFAAIAKLCNTTDSWLQVGASQRSNSSSSHDRNDGLCHIDAVMGILKAMSSDKASAIRLTQSNDPVTGCDNMGCVLDIVEAVQRISAGRSDKEAAGALSSSSSPTPKLYAERAELATIVQKLWLRANRPLDRHLTRIVALFGRMADDAGAEGHKPLKAAASQVVIACIEYDQRAAVAALIRAGCSPPEIKRACVKDPLCVVM